MRTLSHQEMTAVSGAGLLSFLFKPKTTVKVSVLAALAGAVCVDVKSPLANVLVNVTWNGGSSACGCGGSTPTTPTDPEPEIN